MNSSYNLSNLDSLLSESENHYDEYDYYASEVVQEIDFSEQSRSEPGIEAILFTGNRLRNLFD